MHPEINTDVLCSILCDYISLPGISYVICKSSIHIVHANLCTLNTYCAVLSFSWRTNLSSMPLSKVFKDFSVVFSTDCRVL